MSNYSKLINQPTPQTEALDSRQAQNNAGGFVYKVDKWTQLRRFLIIGSAEGTYYVSAKVLTKKNIAILEACLAENAIKTVEIIVDVSTRGLAQKQDAGVFALAVAASYKVGDDAHAPGRQAAIDAVNKVCRTGTTFFQFLDDLKNFRKLTGRQPQRAIDNWYLQRTTDELALQLIKYRSREGWTHRDALRLGHTGSQDPVRAALLKYAVKDQWTEGVEMPDFIKGYELVKGVKAPAEAAKLITQYSLPREALPTEVLTSPEVWTAMLPHMGLTALIRNLANMTRYGVLTNTSSSTQLVISKLTNADYLRKARIHPISVLMALKTYEKGRSEKGENTWTPAQAIVSALNNAFYKSFEFATPLNKRVLIGLDVSGSMSHSMNGVLTAAETAAAMSMYFLRTEAICNVMAFSNQFVRLPLNASMDLNTVLRTTNRMNFGATDCAQPFLWAAAAKESYDVFIIITDNETYAGSVHPVKALKTYRQAFVKDARSIVLATTSTGFSINDPTDPLALDICGFSSDVPTLINQFVLGDV